MRTTGHAFHPYLTVGRMEQGQEFGRPVANILVRAMLGVSLRLPTTTWVR